MKFQTGSLVRARGRDWVVQPSTDSEWLKLRPLGGLDAEIVELCPELETIGPAAFPLPDPKAPGDAASCRLLRDAARLGLRSTTGPFRSFGHIAVEPRPYQLVPLLMALRQPVTRLLIADDVGVGKTVEALLIAREMLDRGEAARMTVLCPAVLAEQWQKELEEKFHIDAKLVLPSTAARLEKGLSAGISLFEQHPYTVVSLDFIKSERRRLDFLRACPELVIVDEAHGCAQPKGSRGRMQRWSLVKDLAANPDRHMIFVTATPHSGKEEVFRSLLAFLDPELENLPASLAGKENEQWRRLLAQYLVQRRRGDITAYMEADTPFPARISREETWQASPEWSDLFAKSLRLARDNLTSAEKANEWRKRLCHWSALALLRAVSSSPAAAAATLRTRMACETELKDEAGARQVEERCQSLLLDADGAGEIELDDTLPGADTSLDGAADSADKGHASQISAQGAAKAPARSRYLSLARDFDALRGDRDPKLAQLVPQLKNLLKEGYAPIVFCRFIQTANYLAEELKLRLEGCAVACVTGELPPAEREQRILDLGKEDKRLLVCTDCLSEGINLQNDFTAVVHYDLSWNPTRHEQREGRVDRFGQTRSDVRVLTWWGKDNPMDGLLLQVLLRKHKSIRDSLGVTVPVPENGEQVLQTMAVGLILRGGAEAPKTKSKGPMLPGLEGWQGAASAEKAGLEKMEQLWQDAAAAVREKQSNTFFAQKAVSTDAVRQALESANCARGDTQTVESFMRASWQGLGGVCRVKETAGQHETEVRFNALTKAQHPALDLPDRAVYVFTPPAGRGQTLLTRTSPEVERMAAYLAETAMETAAGGAAPLVSRCGVMRTRAVAARTTLLLCRFRFLLRTAGAVTHETVCEECALLAFEGAPAKAQWLKEEKTRDLLRAEPCANVSTPEAVSWLEKTEQDIAAVFPALETFRGERANALLAAHRDVRDAAKARGRGLSLSYSVTPQGEADILGLCLFFPPAV